MGLYVGGRQIFEKGHKRCIRGEDNKLNKLAKLLIQMCEETEDKVKCYC
jgi:hypothetical protein